MRCQLNWIEHQISNLGVIGSTPMWRTIVMLLFNTQKPFVIYQLQLFLTLYQKFFLQQWICNHYFLLFLSKNTSFLQPHPSYFYELNKNNLVEAAKNLYSCLRKIKNKGYKSIAVEKISNRGLGKAINDRLQRASRY